MPNDPRQYQMSDPYSRIGDIYDSTSLAMQKGMTVAAAGVEKKRRIDPAAAKIEEERALAEALEQERRDSVSLLDIAESSFYRSGENLRDFVTGEVRDPNVVQQQADILAGVTPEDRQRLVGDPQQQVINSLAGGDYLGAIPQAIKAALPTLADSAQVIPEMAVGAAATAATGGLAGPLVFGNRARKGVKAIENVGKAVSKTQKAVTDTAKLAGTMSVTSATMTQNQINQYTQEHGAPPSKQDAAGMYALNLATMMVDGQIIKQLFIPKFKTQIGKEIKTLGKNIKGGSNIKSVAGRIVEGAQKVTVAGGAEAGQEYFQTWVENFNVSMGPEEKKDFFNSVMALVKDKDKQLEALAGAYLGGGAGGAAKLATTGPAVAVGSAIDTTKGTAKTAVAATKGVTKAVGKVAQHVANEASYKILSQEERDVISSEYESRKDVVERKTAEFEHAIDIVNESKNMDALTANDEIAAVARRIQGENKLTDDDLQEKGTFEGFKKDVVRAYKGDIGLMKTELEASNVAAIAKKSAQNATTKVKNAAVDAVVAASPGVEAAVRKVKQYGDKAVRAVEEIRSSTALGMIELAAKAGKKETAQILEAAKSLSKADLVRTTAVISEFNPDLAHKLQRAVRAKDQTLGRVGLASKDIINESTLNPVVKDIAARGTIEEKEMSAATSAVNQTLAGKVDDMASLQAVEDTLRLIEESPSFKTKAKGTMSQANMNVAWEKLRKIRKRLERNPVDTDVDEVAEKVGEAAASAVKTVNKKVVPKVKEAAGAVKDAVQPAVDKARVAVRKDQDSEVKVSGTFKAVIGAVEKSLKDPAEAVALVESADLFIKQMKRFGVNNRSQFENFIGQFPALQDNVEFFSKLEEAYPSDLVADEVVDHVATKAVSTMDKVKEAYNKMNPPECKV